ncbi:MAG: protein translocase subunit SecF [Deltaproteobacteria bacterium]|nr:protein translocase subunit SecF [Deltaproteobacteria bacterium]
MELIRSGTNIDFVGKRGTALIFSLSLIIITMASLILRNGPNYGIDFAGGTLVHVKFNDTALSIDSLRDSLAKVDLGDVLVQDFGEGAGEYLIRIEKGTGKVEDLSHSVKGQLSDSFGAGSYEVRRVEMVGPQVGDDLKTKALMAILYAMGGILIYVSLRFEFRYALGAIIAIAHDVLVTVGAFAVTGYEISLPVIAAILAVIGYSLNDTIIVYDRIRENMKRVKKGQEESCINQSINETLSRTILTSVTTLIVVLALFLYGGGVIHNFAFALLVGVLIGTYSSIFVASPVLIYYDALFSKTKGA